MRTKILLLTFFFLIVSQAKSQIISTVAGNGIYGFSGDNSAAISAQLSITYGTATDAIGNLYIADINNQRVRKLNVSTGIITTVVGTGVAGFSGDNGPAILAQLNNPYGVAIDAAGNLYISDLGNRRIRKIDPLTAIITTVAGNGGSGFSGDNGLATSAELNNPIGIAVDNAGNIYIGDRSNQRIRKVNPLTGIITTVAGNGVGGFSGDNGAAISAQINSPNGIFVDATGNLYIADYGNHRIRKVTASTGIITTVAGNGVGGFLGDNGPATSAQLNSPYGVSVDAGGNFYIADYSNQRIRKVSVSTGIITTVAGNGVAGYSGDNGSATLAQLNNPTGVTLDAAGNLYISDQFNNRIRKISSLNVTPTINNFSPASGSIGTLLTITGTNLGNATSINIGGVSAIPISNDGSVLVAMVMPGAVTGSVSITTAGGTATGVGNFTVTPTPYPSLQQGGKLVGTGSVGAAAQGISIAISADGNTAIVGGYLDNSNQGAAWIYTRSNGTWIQQGNKLVGSGNVGASRQGVSVAISADGNTAIVGGNNDNSFQGAAWVFTRSGGTWTQQGNKLVGIGSAASTSQGSSVAISADGNTAIVGAPSDYGSIGAVWVFTRSGNVWTQQGNKLAGTGNVASSFQGKAVSISADGNTIVSGGYLDNSNQGAAWVFRRNGGTWTQDGIKLVGTGGIGTPQQGYSVSISADGNTIIVGGVNDNFQKGAAWVFARIGGIWTQQGNKLVGTGGIGFPEAGSAVSISADGNTAILAGRSEGASGALWVFARNGGTWLQQGNKLTGTGYTGSNNLGFSAAISANGNTMIAGGPNDNSSQGAAWMFIPAPINADLSALTISSGSLTPSFVGTTIAYSSTVSNAFTSVSITPTASDALSTITVNGITVASGSASAPINLIVGSNNINVVITGSDGLTTKTYTINVTRLNPLPTISSFTPASGSVGSLVTINGTNLSSPASFSIGGVPAIIISNTGTQLVGMVMPGAVTGTVAVTNFSVTATGSSNFTVVASRVPNTQQGSKLVGTGASGVANQGGSVSFSADGNTALVGGYNDNGVGAVWVYTKSGNSWSQQGNKLVGSGTVGAAYFGFSSSLSADGNTAIIGGFYDNNYQGAAWIFTRTGNSWTQQGNKLVGSGSVSGFPGSYHGYSVSISADGNTAIVGGPYDNSIRGSSWVYTRAGNVWTEQAKLVGTGGSADAEQGTSVSLSADGNTAISTGYSDNGGVGATWFFTRNGNTWTQQGNKLVGTGAVGNSNQGISSSLSADGNTALIGAYWDNGSNGAAWIYTRTNNIWSQQGNKLIGTGNIGTAQQGTRVSLSADGNTAVVGGYNDNSAQGAVWVFTRSGSNWVQQGNKLVGTGNIGGASQGLGVSLSADGNNLLSGGANDNAGLGAAWVFTQANNNADLTSLAISSGTLSPTFATAITSYTVSVTNTISFITLTPTASDITSNIKVNGQNVSSGSSSAAINLAVGNNTITIVVTAADGTTTKTYSINVTRAVPPPVASITASGPLTFCSPGSVLLTAGTATTYQWSLNGSAITGATSNTYTANQSGSYTVTVTNSIGQSATSASTIVTVNPLPTISGITGTINICSGISTTLTAASATLSPVFNWYNAATGGTLFYRGSVYTTPKLSANAIYYVAVTSGAGCVSSTRSATTITVNPLPTATISGTTTVCQNAGAPSITFTGANGTAPYTFTYAINGITQPTVTSTGNTATLSVPTGTAGSYVYTLVSVKDASATLCSNTASGSATVTVNQLPTATISGTTTVCQNAATPTVTFTGANATAPYTFTYAINGITQPTVTSPGSNATVSVPTGTAGSFVYTLVSVKDASATLCSAPISGSATVTVNSLPVVTAVSNSPVCSGTPLNLMSNLTSLNSQSSSQFVVLSAGLYHSMGIKQDGSLWAWGDNSKGQLGTSIGVANHSIVPVQVGTDHDWVSVSCGAFHTLGLKADGSVWAWGFNGYGQLGDGTQIDRTSPVQVIGLTSGVSAIAGAYRNSYAIVNGAVKSWGYNVYGQLGDGTLNDRTTPVQVIGLANGVTAIAAGETHALAIVNGAVRSWGYNGYGQLGDGTFTNQSNPVQVVGLTSGVTAVAAGNYHSFAIVNGAAKNWGNNNYGQLGDGTAVSQNSPVQIIGLTSGVSAIGGGENNSFAIVNGAVKGWGSNIFGYLGVGNYVSATSPVQVIGLNNGGTLIAAGYNHSLAIVSGIAKSWGEDNFGQLGDGASTRSLVPVDIVTTPSGGNFAWTGPNSFTSSLQNSSIANATSTATGTYTVSGTDASGCVNLASINVFVNPLPTATISGTTTVCQNAEAPSITFTGANANAPYTFTYTINGITQPAITSIGNTATVSVPTGTAGSYMYTLVSVQDASTTVCSNNVSGSATVTINPLPTASISGTTSVCQNAAAPSITFTGANATAPYTFTYAINGITQPTVTSTGNTATVSVPTGTAGSYVYTLVSVKDASATLCSAPVSGSATVTVNPLPTVVANASASTVCAGTSVILSGSGATTYNWSGGVTDGVSFVPLSTTTYTVTGTDVNGCQNTAIQLITVNPTPDINPVSDQIVCNNSSATAINFSGSVAGTVFNWTNNNPSIGLAASGLGNIASFTATNSGSLPVTATVTVTPSTVGGGFAYITNYSSHSVSVLNTATNTVVATLAVGSYPYGVSVSPDGTKVYVTNNSSNSVSVINTATNTVMATVAVGSTPNGVSVSPDGTKVYVANVVSNSISVINTATNTVMATVAVGSSPEGVSVSPDGTKVYVANNNSNSVSVINTATNTVMATVAVGRYPYGVSVSPDGNKVYVANYGSNSVSVINTATNTVMATVAVGSNPFGVSVSPDGTKVYVTNDNSYSVSVINTATNTVMATVAVGSSPAGVSVSPDGTKVYVSIYGSNRVSVINTATNTVIATVGISGPLSFGNFITSGAVGCTGIPKTFTIKVNPLPTATISGTTSVCQNAAAPSIIFTGANGTAPYTFTYAINGITQPTVTSTGNTATVSVPTGTVGSYVYTLVSVQDASATVCSNNVSGSAVVTVNALPTPTIAADGPTTFCSGNSATLTSSAGTSYLWSTGATTSSIIVTNSGSYTVTVTNASGCSSSSIASIITVNPLPTVTVGSNGPICAGNAINLSSNLSSNASSPFVVLAGGLYFSLGIKQDGSLWAWGYNGYGQLGTGNTIPTTVPIQVGNDHDWISVSCGDNHSLGLKADGSVWSWGLNSKGQLGDGTQNIHTSPVRVIGLASGVTAISAGSEHSLAIVNGAAKSWGDNSNGSLGDGTLTNQNSPVQVIGLTTGVTAISAGYYYSLAIVNGAAKSWGNNFNGKLGDGTQTNQNSPVQIIGLTTGVTAISAGYLHSLAIVNGAVKSWGYNLYGQLGDGTNIDRTNPVQVIGLTTGVTSITAGRVYSLAIINGAAKSWGYNDLGDLGDGTVTSRTSPVQVTGLTTGVTSIAAGSYHSSFAIVNTAAKSWGYNENGQLGDGTNIERNNPVDIIIPTSTINGTWTGPNSFTSSVQNPSITNATSAATGIYTLTGTDANGCVNTASVNVIVNPLPTATISGTTSVCQNAGTPSITFTGANATAPYTFTYAINGITQPTVTSTGNTATVSVATGTAGSYVYTLISVQDASATLCSNSVSGSATVTINPLPTITAIASSTKVCAGTSVTLTGNGASSYVWTGGITNGIGFIPISSTTYTVAGTDVNGCVNTVNLLITVNPLPAKPTITASSSTTICSGGSVTLNANVGSGITGFVSGIPPANQISCDCPAGYVAVGYQSQIGAWVDQFKLACKKLNADGTLGSSVVYTTTNGVSPGGSPVGPYSFAGNTVMVGAKFNLYTNYISGISGYGQSTSYISANGVNMSSPTLLTPMLSWINTTATGSLFVPDGSVITGMIGFNTYYAQGVAFKYQSINSINNPPSIVWSNTAITPSISVNSAGNYTVTVTDANNCSATSDVTTVTVNPLPTATINGTTTVCQNAATPSITFTGANATAPYTFTYTINGGVQKTITSAGNTATVNAPTGTSGTFTYALVSVKDASSTHCSNTASGSATVTVNTLPTFTACPSNQSVNATIGQCSAPVTYTATATGSPFPTLTYVFRGATTGGGSGTGTNLNFNTGVTIVTITATNSCGSTNCSFTVTVKDTQFPVLIGVPSDVTVECDAVPATATVTATDNCTTSVPTFTEIRTDGNCANNYTLTRTWSTTDASNNTTTQTQVITVQDTKAPILTVPADISVVNDNNACGATVTFEATATDNCSTPTITYSQNPGTIFAIGTTVVTVTATDACGHATVNSFGVTVTDNQFPVLAGVPANATVECNAVPAAGTVTATDNCTTSAPTFTEVRTDGNCANNYTLTRTWSTTDASGNTTTQTQVITVQDTKAPVLTVPADISVANDNNVCGATVAFAATATDNCGTPTITYSQNPGTVFAIGSTVVTVTAKDACGNPTVKSFTVKVIDTQFPVLVGVPANTTVECDAVPAAATVTARDNCTTSVPIFTEKRTNGNCANNYTLTRTWSTTDASNNTSTQTQVITVQDTKAPVLSAAPANVTVDCNAVPVAPVLTATDNCDAAPVVTYSQTSTQDANVNIAAHYNYTITRTWTATDACTNFSSKTQVISVHDVTAPVITVPSSVTLNCQDNTSTTVNGVATGTDNCGPVAITYNDVSTQVADINNAGHYNYTITRTWTATDVTGNNTSGVQTITVQDITKPEITIPVNVTLNCQDNTTTSATGVATGTDNCGPVTITYSDVSTQDASSTSAAHYNYTITRTWTATDVTGNQTSGTQTIKVQDVTKPVIIVPSSVTLNCQDNTITAANGVATGTDNCGPVTITYSDVSTQVASITSAAHYNYTITRTWTATDVSGNNISGVQTIQVQDVTKPVITVPSSVTLNCQDNTTTSSNGVATGTDNCGPVTITYSDASTQVADINNAGHYNYTITRTWTATDVSGNNISGIQTIKVQDITKPVIVTCPSNVTQCNDQAGNIRSFTFVATDNCSPLTTTYSITAPNGSVVNGSGNSLTTGFAIGTSTINWTVKDVSGNTNSCSTVVVVKQLPDFTISSVPTSSVYTGGNNNNLYLGYGAQSTKLQITHTAISGNESLTYTYFWSGNLNGTSMLSSTTSAAPIFTPATAGYYTFTVVTTNNLGCSTTRSISICVTDIRVPGTNGSKVNICHSPPGNTSNRQTLSISVNAVPAHLGNHIGDRLGSCDQTPCGNVIATSTGGISSKTTKEVTASIVSTEEELKVTVMPNPSTTYFTLKLESKYQTPVNMRVMDASGRVVDAKSKIGSNSTIQIGHSYSSGTYYAEMIQGTKRKVVQLIKGRG